MNFIIFKLIKFETFVITAVAADKIGASARTTSVNFHPYKKAIIILITEAETWYIPNPNFSPIPSSRRLRSLYHKMISLIGRITNKTSTNAVIRDEKSPDGRTSNHDIS
jgi:hypothetical protein